MIRLLAEHAVDGGAGDKVTLRRLAETLAALPISQDGIAIESQRFAPDVPRLRVWRFERPKPAFIWPYVACPWLRTAD